ncbi:VWA-like domain-containing protein [Rhodococcus sp. JS3073]|uniref:VWA-like domain-containing protein n=1 Tax=Rhodococcus sp. JS3073 TaxID=3002901 RepID=UPI003FA6F976
MPAEDIPLAGGGGTDLRAGFDRVARGAGRPDVIVALTDGQTPWPAMPPGCRTVVEPFRRPSSWNECRPHQVSDRPPERAKVVEIAA